MFLKLRACRHNILYAVIRHNQTQSGLISFKSYNRRCNPSQVYRREQFVKKKPSVMPVEPSCKTSGKSLQFQSASNFAPINNDQPCEEPRRLNSESGDVDQCNNVTKEQEQFDRHFRQFPNMSSNKQRHKPQISRNKSRSGQINNDHYFGDKDETEEIRESCKAIVQQNRAHPVFKCDQCNRFLKLTLMKKIDVDKMAETDTTKSYKVKCPVVEKANVTKVAKGSAKHLHCTKGCICGHVFEENKQVYSPCRTLPHYNRLKKLNKLCRFRSRSNPPTAHRDTRIRQKEDEDQRFINRRNCNFPNTKINAINKKMILVKKRVHNKHIQISQNVSTKATWTSTAETCTEDTPRAIPKTYSPRSMYTKMDSAGGLDTAIWNNMEVYLKYLNYQKMMLDKRTRTLNDNIMSSKMILRELGKLIAEAKGGCTEIKKPTRTYKKRTSNTALNLKINNFKMAFEDAQQKICGYEEVLEKSFQDKYNAIATNKNFEKLNKPSDNVIFNPLVSSSDRDSLEAVTNDAVKSSVSVSTCLIKKRDSSSEEVFSKVKKLVKTTFEKFRLEACSETEISTRVVCALLQSANTQALLTRDTKKEKEPYANSSILSLNPESKAVTFEKLSKNSKTEKFQSGRSNLGDRDDDILRRLLYAEHSATSTPPGETVNAKEDRSPSPAALSKRPVPKKSWRY